MKKVVTAMLCVMSLALFSFFKQEKQATFKRLAGTLYQSQTTAPLAKAHQEKLQQIIMKQYGLTSFKETVTLNFKKFTNPSDPTKIGFSMAEKTVGSSFFMQTMVNKGAGELDEVNQGNPTHPTFNADVASQVSAILENYKTN